MSFSNHGPFDARQVDRRVRLAMRILEFEQTRVPGIGELAQRVGVSPFHLSRLFAAQIGESCADYSRRIRLDNANNQIIHDTAPLDVVAATFGYASQAAFTRAYTRQFGMSPKQYVAAVLGRTQAEHAASHMDPLEPVAASPLLAEPVRMVERQNRRALVRRFFGYDLAAHWRRFLAELPPGPDRAGVELAGMSYDNARVTPARHWRYDCAAVLADPAGFAPAADGAAGLDVVEVPGGLHAETTIAGAFPDLWRATIGLLTEWLPRNRAYRPEGDPIVHWLGTDPAQARFTATATIRVRPAGEVPAYNLRPLTRHGRSAGERTDPGSVMGSGAE